MVQPLRVFVSSPGDVPEERLRTELVIEKLALEFRRFFAIKTYRWEHEPMLASGHFQDAIDPPSTFDIVILILWSRLGTQLPHKTGVREYRGIDGRVPVTGTEWEYEDALRAARERGAPDILAFRSIKPAMVNTKDADVRAASLLQLDALETFWRRHFVDRGIFLAGHHEYRDTEEFAQRLENSLRKLIERRIRDGSHAQDDAIPLWTGVPFRGLSSYEVEHAQIYFGREQLVAKAAEQLASQARNGTAFLLVSGASGSGKSSLAKAALVPLLMKPQRIAGAAFLRRFIWRPSDGGPDPLEGFLRALAAEAAGDGVGLPELLTPGQKVADLAGVVALNPATAAFLIRGALGRVTDESRRSGHLLGYEEAKLVIVVDQLEELFTLTGLKEEARQQFIAMLAALSHSGSVWIIATIRADFWHRIAEIPRLLGLCQGQGRIDVLPPSGAELAEMIRRPAQVAGLAFDIDAERGLGLDVILAEDAAAQPGVLPLLSFTLEALYSDDVERGGKRVLTNASYKSLGGLKGAIATRAEETLRKLPPASQVAFPKVLRALVTIGAGNQPLAVARAAPMKDFPADVPTQALLAALIEARLVVTSDEGAVPVARLAHEALISRWTRAQEQLAVDRRDIETRVLIEREEARWLAASTRDKHKLLLQDPDLANAIDLDARWGDELPANLRTFIALSHRAAIAETRRKWLIAGVVMLALLALTVASFGALYVAEMQRHDALTAQSKFLARDGRVAVDDGHSTRGMILALAGLPAALDKPDRPYVRESGYALEDAVANQREQLIFRGHDLGVRAAAYSPDRRTVATMSEDGTARLWDSQSGTQRALLRGHTGAVSFGKFSPDGRLFLTASDDFTARLWDARTGEQLHELRAHTDLISFAAVSHNGQSTATASDDQTVHIWDLKTRRVKATLRGHKGSINVVTFSPDDRHLLTGGGDKTAYVWDAENGAVILKLEGHEHIVYAAAFSPGGDRMVTAGWDKKARLWDRQGRLIKLLEGHDHYILSAAFSSDGKWIVTTSKDSTARVWDASTGNSVAVLLGHLSWVNSAEFSPDGNRLVTASNDQTARLWDTRTGASVGVLRGHEDVVTSVHFAADGKRVLTGSSDRTARIWNVETAAARKELRGHQAWVNALAYSRDGRRLATASDDHTSRIWDVGSDSSPPIVSRHPGIVRSAVFSSDGARLITGSDDGVARIWDVASGGKTLEFTEHSGRVWFAVLSPNGEQALSASEDRTALLWDAGSGKRIQAFIGHTNLISSAAFSPDGRRVVTGSWDTTANVWEPETGRALLILKGHDGRVASVHYSPDGSLIATASDDKTARLWDARTGEPKAVLSGHTGWLYSAVFSPDGTRVVTASSDLTAKIWDTRSGALIATLRGHGGPVRYAVFSPDGQEVATASADSTVRTWKLPPRCQELINLARGLLPRGPSAHETARYFLDGRPVGAAVLTAFNHAFGPLLPQSRERCESRK